MKIDINTVYTYQEAMDLLGVKKITMAKLIKEGLKPIKLGKSYRFLGEQILNFLVETANSA